LAERGGKNDCGWKGGDSGNRAKGRTLSNKRKAIKENYGKKNYLTETGVLMEGDFAHLGIAVIGLD
jgi:hypothetical protein